jgi:hypothetical protein
VTAAVPATSAGRRRGQAALVETAAAASKHVVVNQCRGWQRCQWWYGQWGPSLRWSRAEPDRQRKGRGECGEGGVPRCCRRQRCSAMRFPAVPRQGCDVGRHQSQLIDPHSHALPDSEALLETEDLTLARRGSETG